jgi:transcription elongation factor Elf1
MRKLYWTKICPACKEGQLVFQNDVTNNKIYVHCGECEMGWATPMDLVNEKNGFLTLLDDFDAVDPSFEEIKSSIWGLSDIKNLLF